MSWQDVIIFISNIGTLVALIPTILSSIFGFRKIQFALSTTGFIMGFFLVLAGSAVISLGAIYGGSVMLLNALTWLAIAFVSWRKRNKQ